MDSLIAAINELKRQRNAVILAHNYQPEEIQEIGDFVGDSLELSRLAEQTIAEVIVFCGVHFMAETAKILSPEKTVLLPAADAGCPLADSITPGELKALKACHPGAKVVTYVNSSAEIKALSDICCTSANAVEVAASLEENPAIFIPDRNLGRYVEQKLGRDLILTSGFCPVHQNLSPQEVAAERQKHPRALFLAHPECRPEVLEQADFVGSTSRMLKFVKSSTEKQFLIGTESGILHRMKRENPDKEFFLPSPCLLCRNMKKTTLEKVKKSLETLTPGIAVAPEIREKAKAAISAMLELREKQG